MFIFLRPAILFSSASSKAREVDLKMAQRLLENNLATLMDAIEYFYKKTRNRISYEYIAFQNFNDSLEDAANLAKLCKRFPVKVNIIEYNPIDGAPFLKSSEDNIDNFAKHLREKEVMVTVRRSRGKDIDAACGQLANKE